MVSLLQSLDCLKGGSILSVMGGVHFGICSCRGQMRQSQVVQSTTALPECLWLASLLVSPILGDFCVDTPLLLCHVTLSVMDFSRGVEGINETESHCANNCTLRASGRVLFLGCGLSNPQRGLCWHQATSTLCHGTARPLLMHCSFGRSFLSVVGMLYSLLHRQTIWVILWDIESFCLWLCWHVFSDSVTALPQSLDYLQGGSILSVMGRVHFGICSCRGEMRQSRVVQSTTAWHRRHGIVYIYVQRSKT
jgi:hypothetical protein